MSHTKGRAAHEDGVLRTLLNFEAQMSDVLPQHVHTLLAHLQPEFGLRDTMQPLRCVTRGAKARRRRTG